MYHQTEPQASNTNNSSSKTPSIASLVLGILALLCGVLPIISIPLGIAAIALGVVGIKRNNSKGMGIAGIITGSIAIVIGLIVALILISVPALQQNQKDTQVKNDVAIAVSQISTFRSENQGLLPTVEQFSALVPSSKVEYSPGIDCDGVSDLKKYQVSAELSDGKNYCLD